METFGHRASRWRRHLERGHRKEPRASCPSPPSHLLTWPQTDSEGPVLPLHTQSPWRHTDMSVTHVKTRTESSDEHRLVCRCTHLITHMQVHTDLNTQTNMTRRYKHICVHVYVEKYTHTQEPMLTHTHSRNP